MLKTRVIPCLTVKNQKLVKSVQFDEHRNIGSYIAAVRVFNARDVDELVFLDLDARTRGIELSLLEEVTKECFMPVTLGGGVASIADVQSLLSAGADKVAINSAAFEHPELIDDAARRFGSQCIVASIDVRLVGDSYRVFSQGASTDTGHDPVAWAQEMEARGAGEIFLTSIDRDGGMEGYELPLIRAVAESVRIPVIASGGAGNPEHCVEAMQSGATAVAAASMFQYTQATPRAVKDAFMRAGIPARSS